MRCHSGRRCHWTKSGHRPIRCFHKNRASLGEKNDRHVRAIVRSRASQFARRHNQKVPTFLGRLPPNSDICWLSHTQRQGGLRSCSAKHSGSPSEKRTPLRKDHMLAELATSQPPPVGTRPHVIPSRRP